MDRDLRKTIIIAALILSIGFIVGRCFPVYEIQSAGSSQCYKLNRLNGKVWFVAASEYWEVKPYKPK